MCWSTATNVLEIWPNVPDTDAKAPMTSTTPPGLIVPATPRDATITYEPRPDDPAELLGVVVYAMGPT